VRPHDAVDTAVEHLLGDPLVHLGAVGRDAYHGRHRGRQGSGFHDLPAVQQILQALPQGPDVESAVLHLEYDAVVTVGRYEVGIARIARREAHEDVLALLQDLDDAVQTRNVHLRSLRGFNSYQRAAARFFRCASSRG
jgi:hypothetical protein